MAMYDPSLEWAVLRLLARWERLPLSDLERLLDPLQRPHLREELIRDMEWDGLVAIYMSGDEPVIALTPLGRSKLGAESSPAESPGDEHGGFGG